MGRLHTRRPPRSAQSPRLPPPVLGKLEQSHPARPGGPPRPSCPPRPAPPPMASGGSDASSALTGIDRAAGGVSRLGTSSGVDRTARPASALNDHSRRHSTGTPHEGYSGSTASRHIEKKTFLVSLRVKIRRCCLSLQSSDVLRGFSKEYQLCAVTSDFIIALFSYQNSLHSIVVGFSSIFHL